MDEAQFLTARAAAHAYGVSRDSVCRAIRAGDLPALRLGARTYAIRAADIENWLARRRVRPSAAA